MPKQKKGTSNPDDTPTSIQPKTPFETPKQKEELDTDPEDEIKNLREELKGMKEDMQAMMKQQQAMIASFQAALTSQATLQPPSTSQTNLSDASQSTVPSAVTPKPSRQRRSYSSDDDNDELLREGSHKINTAATVELKREWIKDPKKYYDQLETHVNRMLAMGKSAQDPGFLRLVYSSRIAKSLKVKPEQILQKIQELLNEIHVEPDFYLLDDALAVITRFKAEYVMNKPVLSEAAEHRRWVSGFYRDLLVEKPNLVNQIQEEVLKNAPERPLNRALLEAMMDISPPGFQSAYVFVCGEHFKLQKGSLDTQNAELYTKILDNNSYNSAFAVALSEHRERLSENTVKNKTQKKVSNLNDSGQKDHSEKKEDSTHDHQPSNQNLQEKKPRELRPCKACKTAPAASRFKSYCDSCYEKYQDEKQPPPPPPPEVVTTPKPSSPTYFTLCNSEPMFSAIQKYEQEQDLCSNFDAFTFYTMIKRYQDVDVENLEMKSGTPRVATQIKFISSDLEIGREVEVTGLVDTQSHKNFMSPDVYQRLVDSGIQVLDKSSQRLSLGHIGGSSEITMECFTAYIKPAQSPLATCMSDKFFVCKNLPRGVLILHANYNFDERFTLNRSKRTMPVPSIPKVHGDSTFYVQDDYIKLDIDHAFTVPPAVLDLPQLTEENYFDYIFFIDSATTPPVTYRHEEKLDGSEPKCQPKILNNRLKLFGTLLGLLILIGYLLQNFSLYISFFSFPGLYSQSQNHNSMVIKLGRVVSEQFVQMPTTTSLFTKQSHLTHMAEKHENLATQKSKIWPEDVYYHNKSSQPSKVKKSNQSSFQEDATLNLEFYEAGKLVSRAETYVNKFT